LRSVLGFLILATGACVAGGPTDTADRSAATPRLYVLDGGVLASDPARYRLSEAEVQLSQLSISTYLIVHPRGVLMWDAGGITDRERISSAAGGEQRVSRADGAERVVTLGPALVEQLRVSGYAPSDVTHLALSHYHWDHTADANTFAHATWLVRRRTVMRCSPIKHQVPPARRRIQR
jgi:N-acyl homoserine lactone hydrolase